MSKKFSDIAKIVVLTVVLVFTAFITYYCVKNIIDHKRGNSAVQGSAAQQQMRSKSVSSNVWGSYPKEACEAFQQQGLLPYPYKKDEATGKWICATPDVQIPQTHGNKTLQYQALGSADKVTEYRLVLKLDADKYTSEHEAVKKVWAIYITVLLQQLFGINLSENDMQSLATLEAGKSYSGNYNGKLRFVVKSEKVGNQQVYQFDAYGMPMFNAE